MKYFTKDWYELCQKTSEHLSLEESKEAQQFSEEYYQELYQQRLNDFLLDEKEDAHTSFDDYYPKEVDSELLEGMIEEEIKEFKICYLAEREEAKQYYEPEPYDSEKSTEKFRELFLSDIEHYKKILPQEILNDIADIRVFSLDKATTDIIQRVETFCEENEKSVQKTIESYQKYYKR